MDNKTIGRLFMAGFAFLAAAGGVWAWGYYVGTAKHEGEVNLLRAQNVSYKEDLSLLREENKSLSIQVLTNSVPNKVALHENVVETENPPEAIGSAKPGDVNKGPHIDEISLNVGSYAALLNENLLITLVGVEFVSNPFRHVVTANIGTPGKENLTIKAVDPGYRVVYEGYEVRVLSSSTGHARFSAAEMP
jgi:hypothetical protein